MGRGADMVAPAKGARGFLDFKRGLLQALAEQRPRTSEREALEAVRPLLRGLRADLRDEVRCWWGGWMQGGQDSGGGGAALSLQLVAALRRRTACPLQWAATPRTHPRPHAPTRAAAAGHQPLAVLHQVLGR